MFNYLCISFIFQFQFDNHHCNVYDGGKVGLIFKLNIKMHQTKIFTAVHILNHHFISFHS